MPLLPPAQGYSCRYQCRSATSTAAGAAVSLALSKSLPPQSLPLLLSPVCHQCDRVAATTTWLPLPPPAPSFQPLCSTTTVAVSDFLLLLLRWCRVALRE